MDGADLTESLAHRLYQRGGGNFWPSVAYPLV